jgi:hypothetical protein
MYFKLNIIPPETRRTKALHRKKVNALIELHTCARVSKGTFLSRTLILRTIIIFTFDKDEKPEYAKFVK